MFFVGVQLDITAPPTPRAAPFTQQSQSQSRFAPSIGFADTDRQLAATADAQESDTAQQPAMLPSPAASLQAQSQVHSAATWYMCACSTRLSVTLVQKSSFQESMSLSGKAFGGNDWVYQLSQKQKYETQVSSADYVAKKCTRECTGFGWTVACTVCCMCHLGNLTALFPFSTPVCLSGVTMSVKSAQPHWGTASGPS